MPRVAAPPNWVVRSKCKVTKGKMMNRAIGNCWWPAAIVTLLLCVVPCSYAGTISLAVDSSVQNNQVLDGIYVSPYPVDVTAQGTSSYSVGTKLTVFCDDFFDDSYIGKSVGFTTTTFGSDLSGTLFKSLKLYQEAAWLSLSVANNPGVYSYAIWAVLDSQDVWNHLFSSNDQGTCMTVFGTKCTNQTSGVNFSQMSGLLGMANSQAFLPGDFSNWVIYTPMGCGNAGNCASAGILPRGSRRRFCRGIPAFRWNRVLWSYVLLQTSDLDGRYCVISSANTVSFPAAVLSMAW